MAVNYIAVFVAGIAHMVVGMLWYGPLFGKQWMKLTGFTDKDIQKLKKQGMAKTMGLTFIAGLVTAYVLAYTIAYAQIQSVTLAMQVGFWLWLGFAAAVQLPNYLYECKSMKHYAITVGFELVYVLAMAAILAVW